MAADAKPFELQKSYRPFWKAEISLIAPCFIVQGHLIMPCGLKMALKFGIFADFLLHSLHMIVVHVALKIAFFTATKCLGESFPVNFKYQR